MKNVLLAAAVALLAAQGAHAEVVNFNEFSSSFQGSPSFSSGSLTFTEPSDSFTLGVWTIAPSAGPSNGTPYLLDGFSDVFTMTATGGGAFTLDSFSAALGWYTTGVPQTITVTYALAGGGTSGATYTLTDDFTTFAPGLEVTSATFQMNDINGYMSLDDVVINSVPEPAPAMSMLAGLALAAFAARRRASQR